MTARKTNTTTYLVLAFGVILVLGFAGGGYFSLMHAKAKNFPDKPPMGEFTKYYQEVVAFYPKAPFFYKYYLYTPSGYDPQKSYPLVLLLHGVSRHMYGGGYILREPMLSRHPAFVLVPIAPEGRRWGYTDPSHTNVSTEFAMDAVRKVQKNYMIDPRRIYVSGYSMGGVGTYAMVKNYPDVFAAALVLCGTWNPAQAPDFPKGVPIVAAHGAEDDPGIARLMVQALQETGHTAYYIEYPHVGHNVWDYVYTDPKKWEWLFTNQRAQ